MQKFITSLQHPWALVKTQAQTPGKRPGTTVAWLEYRNPDGSYDGGEVWMEAHSGVRIRSGVTRRPRWHFTYKRQKQFQPEEIIHRFKYDGGLKLNPENTVRLGGPFMTDINFIRRGLLPLPGYDEVERPAREVER